MSINKFEKDMNIIKALPDEPNDVGGLTADQLKSKFDEGGIALKDFINDEIVPALEDLTVIAEGAAHTILDKNGNEMAQRPKMQFNGTVTDNGTATVIAYTASDVGAREAEWMPTVEEIGAAPASHVTDKANPHGVTVEQIGAAPAIESAEHAGCYYRMVNGVQQWINPPLLAGVEYLTTERWDNVVVYRKLVKYINQSSLSGTTLYKISHGVSNLDKNYGVNIDCRTEGYQIPYFGNNETTAVTGCTVNEIELKTMGSASWSAGRTWYFDMKYVKTN